ncbi:hypothetical protein CVT24_005081 [Panaeolus cyanescens]|uniref:Uncharacterized protein n=1 Tax=Panaeolus cyanescens TaxID=181874 RepID=A0A409YB13_9AGAR|nr:hypothetical protein CVT24_005081 [Panaeolus cyanescens]
MSETEPSSTRFTDDSQSLVRYVDLSATFMVKKSMRTPVVDVLLYFAAEFPDYEKCVVQTIKWYKEPKGVQHEFAMISAMLTYTLDGVSMNKMVHFRLDRSLTFHTKPPRELTDLEIAGCPDLDSAQQAAIKVLREELQKEWDERKSTLPASFGVTSLDDSSDASLELLGTSSRAVPVRALDTLHRLPDTEPDYWSKRTFRADPLHLYTLSLSESPNHAAASPPSSMPISLPSLPNLRDVLIIVYCVNLSAPCYNVMKDCYPSFESIQEPDYARWASRFVYKGRGTLLPPMPDSEEYWRNFYKCFRLQLEYFNRKAAKKAEEKNRADEAERKASKAEAERMEEKRKRIEAERKVQALEAALEAANRKAEASEAKHKSD